MTSRQTLAERIGEANATFLGKLQHLEAMIAAATAVPAGELAQRLCELRGTAAEHFELEEQNGYLSPLVTCNPEWEVQQRALLGQHRALLQSLDGLIRAAEAGQGLTSDFRDELSHWIGDARQHEEREKGFFDEVREYEPC